MSNSDALLLFSVENLHCCVNTQQVAAIVELPHLVRLPSIVGSELRVFQYQGEVATVISLRRRVGLPEPAEWHGGCVVLGRVAGELLGVWVDEVSEVLPLSADLQWNQEGIDTSLPDNFFDRILIKEDTLVFLTSFERILGLQEGYRVADLIADQVAATSEQGAADATIQSPDASQGSGDETGQCPPESAAAADYTDKTLADSTTLQPTIDESTTDDANLITSTNIAELDSSGQTDVHEPLKIMSDDSTDESTEYQSESEGASNTVSTFDEAMTTPEADLSDTTPTPEVVEVSMHERDNAVVVPIAQVHDPDANHPAKRVVRAQSTDVSTFYSRGKQIGLSVAASIAVIAVVVALLNTHDSSDELVATRDEQQLPLLLGKQTDDTDITLRDETSDSSTDRIEELAEDIEQPSRTQTADAGSTGKAFEGKKKQAGGFADKFAKAPAKNALGKDISVGGYTFNVKNGKDLKHSGTAITISDDGTIHVVRPGDTLWFIAGKYLSNPFRYPELAADSHIHNPDLIYPGDVVTVKRTDGEKEADN